MADFLEADTASSDSTYETEDYETDTTSLTESILEHEFENGRRYHRYKSGQYILPNDEIEKDRLDMHHHMILLQLKGELHLAPIKNPQEILDIGTGTGIWAIDMADKYPEANVLGNDLSPIQPQWVPPNCTFEIDNVEEEWLHKPNHFSFIHSRYMLGSISDWPKLFAQAYTHLKPGGWFEILDPDSNLRSDDNTIPPDSALDSWNKDFIRAASIFQRSVVDSPHYAGWLRDAGFVNVTQRILKLPNAPWPKDQKLKQIGAFHQMSFLEALEGLSLRLFSMALGMSQEEIQTRLVDVRKELKDRRIHTYYNTYVVYAQKPEA